MFCIIIVDLLYHSQVYKAGVHPRFPNGGKMSQHLDSLEIGDTIDIRGPEGKVTYVGRGRVCCQL